MTSPLSALFNMVVSFAMLLIFIRFMLQFAELKRDNPYAEPAYKATPIVDIFARIFPNVGDGRISLAAIVLLFLLQLINVSGNMALAPDSSITNSVSLGSDLVFSKGGATPLYLFSYSAFTLIIGFINAAFYLIIGSIIISWIVVFTQKMHPILGIIMQMAEPILAPFRRIAPNLGMLDLSPMIALFGLILIEIIVLTLAQHFMPMLG